MNPIVQAMREQQQKQYDNAKGFIEWAMQNSRTAEEKTFVCPTCKQNKGTGVSVCSNSFHL